MDFFYRICLWGIQVPVTFIGKENLPTGPALFIANHQSAIDVLLVGVLLQRYPHLWFFKVELLKIPLYGFMINRMDIAVDKSTPRKAYYGILEGIRLTKDKERSLALFPEGGRFSDGKIHDFLWGFAIIAKKTGHPVVPILIVDAYKVYPAGTFYMSYHPIKVVVGKPMNYESEETDETFVKRVQAWFIEQSQG